MSFRGIVDILGVILPLLIIALAFIRLFSSHRKGHSTITIISAILLLLIGLIRIYLFPAAKSSNDPASKLQAIHVSKHTESFNQAFENILSAYNKLTEVFANSDSASVNQAATNLKNSLDNFTLDELRADTLIYQTAVQPYESSKAEVNSILNGPSFGAKKISYKNLSDNLFGLASTVRYDVAKLYWLECENAFGENNPGNWLSKTEQSPNPYGQKDCAEVRTNINFVPADTTGKAK